MLLVFHIISETYLNRSEFGIKFIDNWYIIGYILIVILLITIVVDILVKII